MMMTWYEAIFKLANSPRVFYNFNNNINKRWLIIEINLDHHKYSNTQEEEEEGILIIRAEEEEDYRSREEREDCCCS